MNQPTAEQKDCVVMRLVCTRVSLQVFTKGLYAHKMLTEMESVILKL